MGFSSVVHVREFEENLRLRRIKRRRRVRAIILITAALAIIAGVVVCIVLL